MHFSQKSNLTLSEPVVVISHKLEYCYQITIRIFFLKQCFIVRTGLVNIEIIRGDFNKASIALLPFLREAKTRSLGRITFRAYHVILPL